MNYNAYQGIADEEDQLNKKTKNFTLPKSHFAKYFQVTAALSTIAVIIILVVFHKEGGNKFYSQKTTILKAAHNDYSLSIKVRSVNYDAPRSLENLPWDAIAEPYKKNQISIDSFVVNGVSFDSAELAAASTIEWTIDGSTYTNHESIFQIDSTGVVTGSVTLTATGALGKSVSAGDTFSQDFTIANKYVRREIRTLTTEDRDAFFGALKTVYTTEESVGQALYGEKFHSAEYFLVKHLAGAATTDCDHWHDGAGIVTHHVAITLEMEQSLQAINPTISMPYWEYGMDRYLYKTFGDSPIFQPNWYGEADPDTNDHHLNDGGIWSNLALPKGAAYKNYDTSKTGTLNPYVNAYGMLRSPWNNNPTPLLSRHSTTYGKQTINGVPSCDSFQGCFQSTNVGQIFSCLNGETHGPVHIMIGGAWNEGNTLDDSSVSKFASPNKLLLFKVLWRTGFTRCPISCEVGEECKCAVPQQYLDTYGARGILQQAGILEPLQLDHESDETLLKVIQALEDPGIAGDMYTSGASYDPTFWPLHGSAERLVSLKRAMISQGTITDFDETWQYPTYSPNMMTYGAYLNGVCDWSGVKDASDLTLPKCTYGDTTWCKGHYEDDLLEFGNFQGKGETYTNREFYTYMHPWNDDLPYTYDTFDYDYCTDNGMDLMDYTANKTPNGSGGGSHSPNGVPPASQVGPM